MNEIEPIRLPATLRMGCSTLRASHSIGLMTGLLLPLAAIFILIHLYAPTADGWRFWLMVLVTPLAILLMQVPRLAWIRVTPTGIETHLPRFLGQGPMPQTVGNSRVQWDEVRSVRLVAPRMSDVKTGPRGLPMARSRLLALGRYRLIIETDRGQLRLNPYLWVNPAGRDHRLRIGQLTTSTADIRECVRTAPLTRLVEACGFEIVESRDLEPADTSAGRELDADPADFDLARHKGMLLQLGLLTVAALYGLGDVFIVGLFRPLEAMPVAPYAIVGLLALLLVWRTGRGAPQAERLVVGLLALVAMVAVVYPATLRFNALTAKPQVVEYVATAPGRFEAHGDWPELDLTGLTGEDMPEYWAEYPPGAVHEFTLLRGRAGFYQLDPKPLFERTQAFYRQLPKED